MKRRILRLSQLAIDLLALAAAFALAFVIRFDGVPPSPMVGRLVLTGPYVVAIEYLILAAFGVPRFSWRYVGLRESVRIATAVAAGTALLLVARLAAGEAMEASADYRHFVVPYGVLGVNLFLAVGAIGGVRFARRMLGEHEDAVRRVSRSVPRRRTLLVGAGQAGVLVAQELRKRGDLGLLPVGFVDDDPTKVGMVIQGLPVLGDTAMLP
ncbi:MAG: hypothetical protein FJ104_04135, partial [Deltaproteobacteria bacterium]|nr:hypothetical protein [Deltaproteobacteria bacterium]